MNKFNSVYQRAAQQAFQDKIQDNDFNFMEENDTFGPSLDMTMSEFMDQVIEIVNDLPPEKRKQGMNVAARYIKSVAWDKIKEADQKRGVSL
jgi:hypothetical protein